MPFLAIYVFFFGIIVGSFLNVLIYRLPREKGFVLPRSACPHCEKKIHWYENIPLFSYLFLLGKCSGCKKKISIRYPLVELMTGLAAIVLFERYALQAEYMEFVYFFSVFCVFLVHFFIDLDFKILPDGLNIYLALLTLFYGIFHYPYQYWLYGGLIGFGVPFLITWLFYLVRGKIGLGGGDIKLFGILGMMLGPAGVTQNMFLSCLFGSLIGIGLILFKKMDKDNPIAFGPFIILAASFQVYFPQYHKKLFSLLLGF